MKRLVLKKGFSLQRTPEGASHLVDGRTGDALFLAPADFEALAAAMKSGGLDPEARGPASLAWRFAPFLVLTTELETRSFYELDLGDAPGGATLPSIPAVAPVTKPIARTTTGSIPSFAELASRTQTGSMPAVPAVAPVVQPSPVPAIAPARQNAGFSAVQPNEPKAGAPEGWSLLPVVTPEAPPAPGPAAPLALPAMPDDWSVAAALPEAEREAPITGSRVAEAVSPLLPSIDELIGQALPGVSAVESNDSGLGSRGSPSPAPVSPAPEAVEATASTEPVPSVPPPRASPVPSIAPVVATASPTPAPDPARRTSSAEQELRDALEAAAQEPGPATMPDDEPLPTAELLPLDAPMEEAPMATLEPLPEPAPEPAPGPEQFRSQEENLRAALEQAAPAPEGRAEVQAFLTDTAKNLEAPPPDREASQPASSKKPMVLTFVGVTLLVLGVSASMMLKPGGEAKTPEVVPPPKPSVTAALDASTPPAVAQVIDAGRPAAVIDAGAPAPTPTPEPAPVVDAGPPAPVPPVDAGALAPRPSAASFAAEVIGRGRVKMGEVVAPADGLLTWTVENEQRVKSKQVLGTIAAEGAPKSLAAPSVGLAMLKVESGATVKKGAVVADIIYFEAWAKAVVKSAVPTPTWKCEVVSESAGQWAPCKISVVTPKGAGAQVTVAIEPRWFDDAADATLRVSPE